MCTHIQHAEDFDEYSDLDAHRDIRMAVCRAWSRMDAESHSIIVNERSRLGYDNMSLYSTMVDMIWQTRTIYQNINNISEHVNDLSWQ